MARRDLEICAELHVGIVEDVLRMVRAMDSNSDDEVLSALQSAGSRVTAVRNDPMAANHIDAWIWLDRLKTADKWLFVPGRRQTAREVMLGWCRDALIAASVYEELAAA